MPEKGIAVLKELGEFLKVNGEAIYGTRVCSPYVVGKYAFTKKENKIFVFYLYDDNELENNKYEIPFCFNDSKISLLDDTKIIDYKVDDNKTVINVELDADIKTPYAKVFCIEK